MCYTCSQEASQFLCFAHILIQVWHPKVLPQIIIFLMNIYHIKYFLFSFPYNISKQKSKSTLLPENQISIHQYNNTIIKQYINTPIQEHNKTTTRQYNNTTIQQYNNTAIHHYSNKKTQKYNNTKI